MGIPATYFICALCWIAMGAALALVIWLAMKFARQSGYARWLLILLVVLGTSAAALNLAFTYPIALRFAYSWPGRDLLEVYAPVEWCYDHTPLRAPLRAVAEFVGTKRELDDFAQRRSRGGSRRLLEAGGWCAVGLLGAGVKMRRIAQRRSQPAGR